MMPLKSNLERNGQFLLMTMRLITEASEIVREATVQENEGEWHDDLKLKKLDKTPSACSLYLHY